MSGWNRRSVLGGLAAGSALALSACEREVKTDGGGAAAPPRVLAPSPLARGELANNMLAKLFQPAPKGLRLPADVQVDDGSGPRPLSAFLGTTLLVPLWAEWCAPCLAELPDFARLQAEHGGPGLRILPILTGSRSGAGPAEAARLLAKIKAEGFAPLVETAPGDRLYKTLTVGRTAENKPTLPANLLVDRTGAVVARQFGFVSIDVGGPEPGAGDGRSEGVLSEADKAALMSGPKSIWSTQAGDAVAAALAGGFLDRA